MVTRLYLVRHAEAEGNLKKFFQGRTDCAVTEKGIRQLAQLAERFKNIPLDAIVSSPLKRTRETAAAVNKYHNLEIELNPGIIEINGGKLEGMLMDDTFVNFPEEAYNWGHHPDIYQAPDGESMQQVYDRMAAAVTAIAETHSGKNIAVVSHGCALKCFLCYACGFSLADMHTKLTWSDNTAVSCLEYNDGKFFSIYLNDDSHLTDDTRTDMLATLRRFEEDENTCR